MDADTDLMIPVPAGIRTDKYLASVPKTIEVVINIDPQGLC
jgi:hypothetical protein